MEKEKTLSIVSSVLLIINTFVLLVGAFIISRFYNLFKGFNVELTTFTRAVLSFRYLFIVIAFGLIAKEMLKNKTKTLIINAVMLVVLFCSIPAMVIGLYTLMASR